VIARAADDARRDVEQELQDFSYQVSHDLAAALRQVTAFSQLLLEESGSALSERQRSHAERITAANTQCQAMMEQLLVFSRAQQKALVIGRQAATPIVELAKLQCSMEVYAQGSEVAIAPLGEVDADADLLALALRHLLDNALKFHPRADPARVSVSSAVDQGFWRLRIADKGIGVEPPYREPAFRMFRRLNRDGEFPGAGAGLAICRRIARRHGGDVQFQDCDVGAVVELSLPHAAATP
jgi:signal transduction histidine kinase